LLSALPGTLPTFASLCGSACSTNQVLLEGFNSSDAVEVLSGEVCEFSYPD